MRVWQLISDLCFRYSWRRRVGMDVSVHINMYVDRLVGALATFWPHFRHDKLHTGANRWARTYSFACRQVVYLIVQVLVFLNLTVEGRKRRVAVDGVVALVALQTKRPCCHVFTFLYACMHVCACMHTNAWEQHIGRHVCTAASVGPQTHECAFAVSSHT